MTKIEKGGLLNITALSKLNLANNSIHTIGKDCWEFTQRIIHLDLSQNQLNEINAGTFDKLNKLKILDLHGNQISTIGSGALNATYNLESLDLSQNRISATIEDSYAPFASLNKLDTLYLNDNHIKAINKNAFLGLVSLTKLDISNNNITTIQDGAFQDQRNTQLLQHLNINSTDMICDCNVSWFYFWAKSAQSAGVKRQSGSDKSNIDVRCAFPFALRNRRLLQLQKDDLTCRKFSLNTFYGQHPKIFNKKNQPSEKNINFPFFLQNFQTKRQSLKWLTSQSRQFWPSKEEISPLNVRHLLRLALISNSHGSTITMISIRL